MDPSPCRGRRPMPPTTPLPRQETRLRYTKNIHLQWWRLRALPARHVALWWLLVRVPRDQCDAADPLLLHPSTFRVIVCPRCLSDLLHHAAPPHAPTLAPT